MALVRFVYNTIPADEPRTTAIMANCKAVGLLSSFEVVFGVGGSGFCADMTIQLSVTGSSRCFTEVVV